MCLGTGHENNLYFQVLHFKVFSLMEYSILFGIRMFGWSMIYLVFHRPAFKYYILMYLNLLCDVSSDVKILL